ncbi:MAG: hypothetical protein HYY09_08550 [Firmicutes bacterium]|nr:hypothetical protein [Bacillota bacterium]
MSDVEARPVRSYGEPPRRKHPGLGAFLGSLPPVTLFGLFSLSILILGALLIGTMAGRVIKQGILDRTAAITSLYVDSFISSHLQGLGGPQGDSLAGHEEHFRALIFDSNLGHKIASFKVWSPSGRILYASDEQLIGQTFSTGPRFRAALHGEVISYISRLQGEENRSERQRWSRLVETYAPVREHDTGRILAVVEFYQVPDELEEIVAAAGKRTWILVGVATLLMYLLLNGMFRKASRTQLAVLLENSRLKDRLFKVAAQKTETDERLLFRIAQDLHDGPVQDISTALLRIASLYEHREPDEQDFHLVQSALGSSLQELRDLSAGLRLPSLQELTTEEVIRKACDDHLARTGSRAGLELTGWLQKVQHPVKIAIYRTIREALNNAY